MSFIKYQKEFLLVMTSIIHPKAVIWWGNFLHYYVYLIVQWTIYNLSIHPSISPSINLCINQSICKSINQSINQFSYEFCPVCIIITFILPHCCENVIGQIMLQICFYGRLFILMVITLKQKGIVICTQLYGIQCF